MIGYLFISGHLATCLKMAASPEKPVLQVLYLQEYLAIITQHGINTFECSIHSLGVVAGELAIHTFSFEILYRTQKRQHIIVVSCHFNCSSEEVLIR